MYSCSYNDNDLCKIYVRILISKYSKGLFKVIYILEMNTPMRC